MFYLRYTFSELGRRKGRTVLTALGLAVGVGLVVTVTALSNGLDKAQSEVLNPLTGVGTDMSVSRPLQVSGAGDDQSFGAAGGSPGAAGAGLSKKEQKRLEKENGGDRVGLDNLGKPGQHFSQDSFMSSEISFPAAKANAINKVEGVEGVAEGLSLNSIHTSGKVPEQSETQAQPTPGAPPTRDAAGGPPNSINFSQSSVSGIDVSEPDLGRLTQSQISKGDYFNGKGHDQAVLSVAYANQNDLGVGDEVSVGGHKFAVVGLSDSTVSGETSDIYVPLGQLQNLSDRVGRINVLQVRASSSDEVDAVASRIESTFGGSEVTTSKDLADEVSGSLVDAKNLSGKLGTALGLVALLGAFGTASLLTLSSVNKRTRELGTLKALGWRQSLVVRQVAGESVVQGVLGGLAGAAIGIGGAAAVGALGISLDASVAAQQAGFGPPGGGPFGQGAVEQAASTVTLGAPIDLGVIALAIGLAVLGGLIAGTVGGLRAARLRPAEALRSVE